MDWNTVIQILLVLSPFLFALLKTLRSYGKVKLMLSDITALFVVIDGALYDDNVTEEEWNAIYEKLKKLIDNARKGAI